MTAVNLPAPEGTEAHETDSLLHAENASNADLYLLTPPAYTMSVADNETTLDAESVRDEKTSIPPRSPVSQHGPLSSHPLDSTSSPMSRQTTAQSPLPTSHPLVAVQEEPSASRVVIPIEHAPTYFSPTQIEAALAHMKKCNVLPNRPAAWVVKKKDVALSTLAATTLIKEGIIRAKDLQVVSASAGVRRDPTDPLSAILFATYDTVGDMMLGVVEGPVEAYRQFGPQDASSEHTLRKSSQASATAGDWSKHQEQATRTTSSELADDGKRIASGTGKVAVSAGKGLGRIVGTTLKAPMTFTHGLTRGFHNAPMLYGDEVREVESVTGVGSGLKVGMMGLGTGILDGVSGIFVQPIKGARDGGAVGFAKGFGKGIGGAVCKPAAGVCGVPGYFFAGIYEDVRKLKPSGDNNLEAAFKSKGESEWAEADEQTRKEIVRRWCQVSMRQHRS